MPSHPISDIDATSTMTGPVTVPSSKNSAIWRRDVAATTL
jgi:hypothetical protein